jgi:hypothetical protein
MTISPSTCRRTRSCSPRSSGWPACLEYATSTGAGSPACGPPWPASLPPSVVRACRLGTRIGSISATTTCYGSPRSSGQATSPEYGTGSLLASGFLFNLEKIFEDFIVGALSEELQARHGGVSRHGACYLDEARAVPMKPDLVWQRNGQPVGVVDAKYKLKTLTADLYQVLAYCTALRLPHGHLVYAQGNAKRHAVRYSGIEIVCHALDLTLPPAKLLAQVGDIADELVANSPAA